MGAIDFLGQLQTGPQPRPAVRRAVGVVAAVCWGIAVISGFLAIFVHAMTAGPGGEEMAGWPVGAGIARGNGRPTLVLFAHPRCPCLGATLTQLDRVLSQREGRMETDIVVLSPPRDEPGWQPGGSIERLMRHQGVHLYRDRGGAVARRFGAFTSGDIALFAPDGRLVFRGGITPARGHEGDNPGQDALLTLVAGRPSGRSLITSPVFGCPLDSLP